MKRIFPFRVPAPSPSFTILVLGPLLLWLSYLPIATYAQLEVTTAISPTDGTGSPASLGTIITSGTSTVPINLCTASCVITGGTRAGNNLFHSLGDFNIGASDSARFQTGLVNPLADASVSNILARVTGGSSSLYGGLDSATYYPSANLFLMNPAGFLFGPNATVNVGGMMTFTTADYMRLSELDSSNPGIFYADTAQTSILTSAPVAAFGFIGANPHSINFIGGQLTVASGTGLALVGGDISLTPDSSVVPNVPSSITTSGRPILMTSVAGQGEVAADTGIPAVGTALGTIALGQGTTLSTVGNLAYGDGSGGAVSIRGGQFVASSSTILSSPAVGSTGRGGEVMITTTGSTAITNSTIDTQSRSATGGGGTVSVAASDLTLQNSTIFTRVLPDSTVVTPTTGVGGTVTLNGAESVTLSQSLINTTTQRSNGNGGAVTVTSPIVTLEDSNILTGATAGNVSTPRTASGGSVTLGGSGADSVSMTRSSISTLSSETTGNSGSVTITGQNIMIGGNGGQETIVTNAVSTSGDPNLGNGGDIQITGTNVTFTDYAFLNSVADSPGTPSRGGNIRIDGAQNILLDNGTFFATSTTSDGNAGRIELTSQHVTITGQSALASDTFGPGGSGIIVITGIGNIALESGSTIFTTASAGSQGTAGHVELNTPQLTITGGSAVRSETFGAGLGGTITIQGTSSPAQSVLISEPDSGIFTNAYDIGTGGSIFVNANSVTLQNGAHVTSSSTGTGNAGNIQISAGQAFTASSSAVTTEADHASGGAIKITTDPSGTVQLINSTISASVLDGTGGGGSVNIDPQFVILQNSHILATATHGPGGNISITTNLLLPDAYSTISASSQFGVNGTVTIQSPNAPASGKIQPLGKTPLQATSLLNQHCAALVGGEFSSFTVAGRDSLPTEPGSWLASPLVASGAGEGLGVRGEGMGVRGAGLESMTLGASLAGETALLSLRQIAPAGFLTQAFALDWSAGCQS